MNTTHIIAAAVGLGLVLAGGASVLPADRALVVEDVQSGQQYLSVPVDDGTVVALEYTHSVEQTRVYDEYTVRDTRLEMTRMEFESYGWGLPSGADVDRENGTFVYDPPGNYSSVSVSPGETAGHELIVGDQRYDLVARTDGQSVSLRVTRRSALAATIANP